MAKNISIETTKWHLRKHTLGIEKEKENGFQNLPTTFEMLHIKTTMT